MLYPDLRIIFLKEILDCQKVLCDKLYSMQDKNFIHPDKVNDSLYSIYGPRAIRAERCPIYNYVGIHNSQKQNSQHY